MQVAALYDDLSKIAFYCLTRLQNEAEPFDPKEPLFLLAQRLREIPEFQKPATELGETVGFNPSWPYGPKGKEELQMFFDLKALWLELFSIQWEFSDIEDYRPGEDTLLAVLDFCDEVFHWARGQWAQAMGNQA